MTEYVIQAIKGAASTFTGTLSETCNNVISVELIKAIVENTNNYQYIILRIDNMPLMKSSNATMNYSFCTLECNDVAAAYFLYAKEGSEAHPQYTFTFSEPKKINDLRISLLDSTGAAIDNGDVVLIFKFQIQRRY